MNQFSRRCRATRHLRVAPSRFHGGRHVPKWHVPRGVRACPPTRLEEVHPSRVHRSRRKAVVGSPRWGTTGDTRDTRFPVGFTLLFAFLLRRRRRTGEGNSVQRTADTNSLPLTLVAPPPSSRFRRCHSHSDVINVDAIRRCWLRRWMERIVVVVEMRVIDGCDKNWRWRFIFDFLFSFFFFSIVGDTSLFGIISANYKRITYELRIFEERRKTERLCWREMN